MTQDCRVLQSDFARSADFAAAGDHLDVQMLRPHMAFSRPAGKETMFAVIEGGLRLTCTDDGESHDLLAGEGLLVPAGTPLDCLPRGDLLLYVVSQK